MVRLVPPTGMARGSGNRTLMEGQTDADPRLEHEWNCRRARSFSVYVGVLSALSHRKQGPKGGTGVVGWRRLTEKEKCVGREKEGVLWVGKPPGALCGRYFSVTRPLNEEVGQANVSSGNDEAIV